MEEFELEKHQEIVEENEKIPSKSPINSQRKAPNEKRSTIIIGVVAGLLVLSVAGTFIGASIYEKNNSLHTPTPSFNWDVDRSGFFDKDGNFLDAGKSYHFIDQHDDADRKYIQITSVEAPENAYSYVFPSYLNNMTGKETETLPIYAVGRELKYDDNFETNFDSIKKNVFGFPETNKGITNIYFQSLYKEICDYSFYECVDLEKVEFRSFATGNQKIGNRAFAECKKLKEVVLSSNLSSIGDKAFENDESLETVSLPKGIKSIGAMAFKGTSITNINYVGSKADWDRIAKSDDWSDGLSNCKIHYLEEGTEESI